MLEIKAITRHKSRNVSSPFKPNGSRTSIFVVALLGNACTNYFLIFIQILHISANIEHQREQTMNTLIRRRVLRRLIWVYLVCLCPAKFKDA